MKTKTSALEILNSLHKINKGKITGLYDLLYQILINKVHVTKVFCLVVLVDNHLKIGLAIANTPGYLPTTAILKGDMDYDTAQAIVEDLNKGIWGYDTILSARIVFSSMIDQPDQQKEPKANSDLVLTEYDLNEIAFMINGIIGDRAHAKYFLKLNTLGKVKDLRDKVFSQKKLAIQQT